MEAIPLTIRYLPFIDANSSLTNERIYWNNVG